MVCLSILSVYFISVIQLRLSQLVYNTTHCREGNALMNNTVLPHCNIAYTGYCLQLQLGI